VTATVITLMYRVVATTTIGMTPEIVRGLIVEGRIHTNGDSDQGRDRQSSDGTGLQDGTEMAVVIRGNVPTMPGARSGAVVRVVPFTRMQTRMGGARELTLNRICNSRRVVVLFTRGRPQRSRWLWVMDSRHLSSTTQGHLSRTRIWGSSSSMPLRERCCQYKAP